MFQQNFSDFEQTQVHQHLWTENLSFIKAQEQTLSNISYDSPFLSCWKIFEFYNSVQTPLFYSDQSSASSSSDVQNQTYSEIKKITKFIKKSKKASKKLISKRLCIKA